ncbi:hypothetical protein [Halalkalibacter urbisdiaboli]|uniref:hypothetical protein n=1 Tax=Halalkalibacter urbisdiaboli TaxID=1960589 RepID=UPI0010560FE3|nr:hypothetical protein [Halalkalibacter urbisdiaboli]
MSTVNTEMYEHEVFFTELYDYVAANVNFQTYHDMTEEKREKLRVRMTILACKKFAPKKNYGILREEVYDFVSDVIEHEYRGRQIESD